MRIINIKELDNILIKSISHIIVLYFDSMLCHTSIPKIPMLETMFKINNNIIFKIIDIERSPEIVEKLDITSIPLLQIYKDNERKDEVYGNDICNENVKKKIDKYLL